MQGRRGRRETTRERKEEGRMKGRTMNGLREGKEGVRRGRGWSGEGKGRGDEEGF